MPSNKTLSEEIVWEAREFIDYPKGKGWMIGLFTVSLLLIGYFLFKRDFLTALLFLLLFILAFSFSRAKPRIIKVKINQTGLKLDDLVIPWERLKSFWIIHDPEVRALNFETTAYLSRFITLQLEDQDPSKIREFLLKYLPEDVDRREPLTDKLARKLRF